MTVTDPTAPRITILLASYNGARHLPEQLDSYLAQSHAAWDLWVSDDGSTDATREIVARFAKAQSGRHAVRLVEGPRRGPAANFLSLLAHPELPEGPVALSDQDDVWRPEKLARALTGLARGGPVTLYGAQSVYTDEDLRPIGRTRPPRHAPSFANALAQNVVSGHSSVLSPGAVDLVRRSGVTAGPEHHDWWLYLLVAGAGGAVVVDPEEVALYRQHGANQMGAHRGLRASWARARLVMRRDFSDWVEANLDALARTEPLLTEENRAILARVRAARRRRGPLRALALARAGVHRQSRLTSACLYLAAGLGRF
ncbi:glycosyltransferase [Limimaricola pyoseonensis]|uniref:Glycosyltransferase involved in cell wall bisynthesis n=1 Tax=Limimaricola pyoseonensis TaxID=521013 RepID=A0A1G7KJ24_9RHOB|nr:glycosyltransferase [Limimaricola pyoseonensis]SDF37197.1 Glycosyltransferase involved in cell wall bisynthesis [Limimaricola pyoseonensis]